MSGTVTPLNGLRPDIPLQVGQGVAQPQNPLATFGQFANIQNALTQNRALEAGITQTETGTRGMEQSQKIQRIGIMGQIVGGMLLENPNGVPASAVADGAAHLLSMGVLKRDEIGPLLSALPMGDDPASTAARTSALRQFQAQALGIGEQVGRVRGVPTVQNTGGELVPGMLGEGGWRPTPGAMPNTMAPGQAAGVTQLPVIGPDGRPTGAMEPVTGAEVARRGGLGGLVAPGTFSNGGRMPPAATAPAPSAPVVAPPAVPARPALPAATPPPAAPTVGSLGVTQTPGAAAAQLGNAQAGVQMGTDLTKQADAIPAQKAMLGEMETALEQFTTGKGQSAVLDFKRYVQSLGGDRLARVLGVDPQQIASADVFQKLATQIALAQGSAMGLNTDQARANLFGGNPNMDLSKLGNKQIIHMLQGNADAIAAKAQAWRESPFFQSGDYAAFSNAWNRTFDPRVFQWAYMDEPERRIMMSSAGKDGKELAAKLRAMYGTR